MSRCKQCGEPEISPDKFGCGSTPSRQSARCMRLVDPSYRQKKRCGDIDFGGCPRSKLRRDIEAMEVGQSRLIIDESQDQIEHVQVCIARSKCGHVLMLRKLPEGVLIHKVPEIADMRVGESVRYTDDLWMITRLVYARNREYSVGRGGPAYCFNLVDGFYQLRRLA